MVESQRAGANRQAVAPGGDAQQKRATGRHFLSRFFRVGTNRSCRTRIR
jgi:hypothetical protein